MTKKLNEDSLAEQPVISWLKELGYDYEFGPDLAPGSVLSERDDFREVLLKSRLERSLKRINPECNDEAIQEAHPPEAARAELAPSKARWARCGSSSELRSA